LGSKFLLTLQMKAKENMLRNTGSHLQNFFLLNLSSLIIYTRYYTKKSSVSSIFSTFYAKLYVVIPLQTINFIFTKEVSLCLTVPV
jgi:hypothetical protein